jgi:chromosome segregation ATPase
VTLKFAYKDIAELTKKKTAIDAGLKSFSLKRDDIIKKLWDKRISTLPQYLAKISEFTSRIATEKKLPFTERRALESDILKINNSIDLLEKIAELEKGISQFKELKKTIQKELKGKTQQRNRTAQDMTNIRKDYKVNYYFFLWEKIRMKSGGNMINLTAKFC